MEQLNIPLSTIYKLVIATVSLYFLYAIKDILVWFVFALILGILFNYIIDILEQKKIPRLLSAVFLYLTVFALLSFFVYKTAPLMLNELQDFVQNLPHYLQRISPFFEKIGIEAFKNTAAFSEAAQKYLEKMGGSMLGALASIFGGAASTVFVLAMAFFISLERNFVEKILGAFSPPRHRDYLFGLWRRAKKKVSGWFITRLIGVVFVGACAFIVLTVLKVKYAFILSVIAGLFDLVPFIGPLAAGLLLFSFVSLTSLPQAIFVAVAFVIIQQLENNLLFPVLFRKFMGVPPVLVLMALAVGGKIWGIVGAILAIPMAGVLFEILKDYLLRLSNKGPSSSLTPNP